MRLRTRLTAAWLSMVSACASCPLNPGGSTDGGPSASACGVGCTSLSLSRKDALPVNWKWVVRNEGDLLIGLDELGKAYDTAGNGITAFGQLCDDVTNEIQSLVSVLPKTPTIPQNLKYFVVLPQAYNIVELVSDQVKFDANASLKPTHSVQAGGQVNSDSMAVSLMIAYTTHTIRAQDPLIDCMRRSLRNAGQRGGVSLTRSVLVGGIVLLDFTAYKNGGGVFAKYGDLFNVNVDVDLNKTSLTLKQYGRTNTALNAQSLLAPLQAAKKLDPIETINVFRRGVDESAIVAFQREDVDLGQ